MCVYESAYVCVRARGGSLIIPRQFQVLFTHNTGRARRAADVLRGRADYAYIILWIDASACIRATIFLFFQK